MEGRRFEQKKTLLAGLVGILLIVCLSLGSMLWSGGGWRLLVVFGFLASLLGVLVGLYLLARADFAVEVSPKGVRAWVLGKALVPWSDIHSIDHYALRLGSRPLLTLIELRFVAPRPGAPGIVGDLFPGWAAKRSSDKALLNDLTLKASGRQILAALEEGLAAHRAAESQITPAGNSGPETGRSSV